MSKQKRTDKRPTTSRPIPSHFIPEQMEFIQAVRDTNDHLFLRATAGSGKTTTTKEAAWHIDQSRPAAYFIYSRVAREQVGPGLPPFVPARTIHADGLSLLYQARGKKNININSKKSLELAQTAFPQTQKSRLHFIAKLWNNAREHLISSSSQPQQIVSFLRQHQLEKDQWPQVQQLLSQLTRLSLAHWRSGGDPDFSDQLWLPLQLDLGKGKLGTLFVDEAQDLTPLRQAYVQHVLGIGTARPGRLILVGDPDQAIFQYSGADPLGMERLAQKIGAREMPLPVSWRCPTEHIAIAHHVSQFIQASVKSKAGEVQHVAASSLPDLLHRGQTVLARNNAALVKLALELFERQISVDFQGRELGQQLSQLAQSALPERFNVQQASQGLREALEKQSYPFRRAIEEGEENARRQLRELEDVFNCIEVLTWYQFEKSETAYLRDVLHMIERLCRPGGEVILSSIHRAKGLEWPDVTLLYPETLPLRYGSPEEERCVLFVALTRSMHTLRFAYGEEAWAAGRRVQPYTPGSIWMPEPTESLSSERQTATMPTPPQPGPPPPPLPQPPQPVPPPKPLPATPRPRSGAGSRTLTLPTLIVTPPTPVITDSGPRNLREEERRKLTQAQHRLNALREQNSLLTVTQVPDERHLSLFKGQDHLRTELVRRLLCNLATTGRPALTQWAIESIRLLDKYANGQSVIQGSRTLFAECQMYLRNITWARKAISAPEREQPVVFRLMGTRTFQALFFRTSPGKQELEIEVDNQLLRFDSYTGEILGQPFELWTTFAKVN